MMNLNRHFALLVTAATGMAVSPLAPQTWVNVYELAHRDLAAASGDIGTESGLNYAHNCAFAANGTTGSLLVGGNLNNLLTNVTYEFDTLWVIREWNPPTSQWTTVDDSAL